MSTDSDDGTKQWWPADFLLIYRVTFGKELSMELELHNTGVASLSFRGSAACLPQSGRRYGWPAWKA